MKLTIKKMPFMALMELSVVWKTLAFCLLFSTFPLITCVLDTSWGSCCFMV